MKNLFQLEIERIHALGCAIIMIKPKDKRPVDSNWTSGPRKTLAALTKQYQVGMNIGVRLGTASKLHSGKYLAIIDCDLKSDDKKDLAAMHSRLDILFPEWKQSPRVMSGRGNGSMHIYVSVKTPLKKINLYRSEKMVAAFMGNDSKPSKRDEEQISIENLKKGMRLRPAFELDFLCEGQQCVIPPSIHPLTGEPYVWGKVLGSEKDLIDAHFIKYDMQPKAVGKTGTASSANNSKFQFEIQNIALEFESRISDKYINLIMSGEGIEAYKDDRTNALMACILHMVKSGLNENDILTYLTDREYFLGQVAYDHRKTDNRMNAADWLYKYNLKKAIQMINDQKSFDDEVEFIDYDNMSKEDKEKTYAEAAEFFEKEVKPVSDWQSLLQKTESGNIKKTPFNMEIILKHKLKDMGSELYYDAFYGTEYIIGDVPWTNETYSRTPREVLNRDFIDIRFWASRVFKVDFGKDIIIPALIRIAGLDRRHAVKDYLNSCVWDKKPRVNTWIKDYMNSTDSEKYISIVGRNLIKALVYRIYNPGCQFDQVVIFQGGQGVGKSSALRALGGIWFTDNLGNIAVKDTLMILHQHWLIEVSELDSMNKTDADHFKKFVSTQIDTFRKPYDAKVESHKRESVLVGTTNQDEFLKDATGNRRFWPVTVGKVDVEGLKNIRDQLFAEAVEIYKSGEALWTGVDEEFKSELAEIHENRMVSDDMEEKVINTLAKMGESEDFKTFTLIQLWEEMEPLSGGSVTRFTDPMRRKFAKILRDHGYANKPFAIPKTRKKIKKWYRADKNSLVTPILDVVTSQGVTDVGF